MITWRKNKITVGSNVKILSGNERGKIGKVIVFDRQNGYVKIQGINMKTHFQKKSEQSEGGIFVQEGWIPVCKVKLTTDQPINNEIEVNEEVKINNDQVEDINQLENNQQPTDEKIDKPEAKKKSRRKSE